MDNSHLPSDFDIECLLRDPTPLRRKVEKKKLRSGTTPEDKVERRRILKIIMNKYAAELEIPTVETLVSDMATCGWKADKNTIYRDKLAIKRTNTFVKDLGSHSYSQYQEDINNVILYTIKNAKQNYLKDWKVSKAVTRRTPKGETVEAHTSSEIPGAKKMFLEVMLKGADLLMKHTNGENINRSAAMLKVELDNLITENNILKSKLLQKGMDDKEIAQILSQ